MYFFKEDQLQRLRLAETPVIETRRSLQTPSHTTPVWVVVVDRHVYVRSYRGQAGRWYQEVMAFPFALLHVREERLAVHAVDISDEAVIAQVSQALLQKYSTSSYVDAMVRPEILGTTLRLQPAALTSFTGSDASEPGATHECEQA
jgi:hypothetical protein